MNYSEQLAWAQSISEGCAGTSVFDTVTETTIAPRATDDRPPRLQVDVRAEQLRAGRAARLAGEPSSEPDGDVDPSAPTEQNPADNARVNGALDD